MRLQTKLTLAFAVAACLPLGAAVGTLSGIMEAEFDTRFRAASAAALEALDARIVGLVTEVDEALGRVAQDPVLEAALLEPLRRGRFYGDQVRERALVREASRLVTSPTLDALRILDLHEGGRVLAMGHRSGLEPPDIEVASRLAAGRSGAFVRPERFDDPATGAALEREALHVVRPVDERVVLVGGRRLDDALLEGVLAGSEALTALALRKPGGVTVASTFAGPSPPEVLGGYATVTREFRGAGASALELQVWIARDAHERSVAALWRMSGWIALVSVVLALFAGWVVSLRVSRPLVRLSEAAERVARGARDQVVPEIRGRDEIATLTSAFNTMADDLGRSEARLRRSERVAAWREIARRIAHEMRNPLFPIQMAIESLQRAKARQHPRFDAMFETSTVTILEEVARLTRIVGEFSDFARMPSPRLAAVDLRALVDGQVALLDGTRQGVALRVDGPATLMAEVDPDQLRQVTSNLLKNAVEALEGVGGSVVARLELATDVDGPPADEWAVAPAWVVMAIVDDGPGMDDETAGQLFTPYFTTKTEGTGLGLAIVQRIVEAHGGYVTVRSSPAEGTEMRVVFPRERGVGAGLGETTTAAR